MAQYSCCDVFNYTKSVKMDILRNKIYKKNEILSKKKLLEILNQQKPSPKEN